MVKESKAQKAAAAVSAESPVEELSEESFHE
jgi:hypothetical protein